MAMKVASWPCFQWSQPVVSHSPSSSQTLASAASSPCSSTKRCRSDGVGSLAVCRYRHDSYSLFGSSSNCLRRSRSLDHPKSRTVSIKRACTSSLDAFSDEEFSKRIQELALRFQLFDDDNEDFDSDNHNDESTSSQSRKQFGFYDSVEQLWPEHELSDIERKANSVELPFSLRMIKKKMQWEEGFREVGESAYCSVNKAFSSMVFIIRELHSYTLQMRELLFTEDLQGVLVRVQKEMHASFVWLFQQVFSHTPTLMVYVMILLANFTVHSMGSNAAIAAASPPPTLTDSVSFVEFQDQNNQRFDSSSVKTFSVSSSGGKSAASVGGNSGGGGKLRPVASGTDGGGDNWFDRSNQFGSVIPDGASQLSSPGTTGEAESVSGQETREAELRLWNSIVDEARKMQALCRGESLDNETMQRFVSPIEVNIEADDYSDYIRTELLYQIGLSQDPNNSLLLTNYAQFLSLVAHDYNRAEEYFKRAVAVEPADAEAYSKYASFLWRIRNDLWAAEETFLEAINADPTNSYYAANYANFLWNTGGEDTCFPLNSQDNTQQI